MKEFVQQSYLWLYVIIGVTLLPMNAIANTSPFVLLQQAREHLRKGRFKGCERLLVRLDQRLSKPKQKMHRSAHTFVRLTGLLMWVELYKFRSKSYFARDKLGRPIVYFTNMKKFAEDGDFIRTQIQRLEESVTELKEAQSKLSLYYKLLLKKAKVQGQLRDEVKLISARSALNELKSDINDHNAQVSRLRLHQRLLRLEKKNKDSKRMQQQEESLARLRLDFRRRAQEQERMRQEQRRVAFAIYRLQKDYKKNQYEIIQQQHRTNILLWSGVGTTIVGVAGLVTGGILLQQGSNGQERLVPQEAQLYMDAGVGSLVGSSVVTVVGTALLVTGLVLRPNPQEQERSVIRVLGSYNEYMNQGTVRLPPFQTPMNPLPWAPTHSTNVMLGHFE